MAIHISNEALDLHVTLSQPVKLGEATTSIRMDNGSTKRCHLHDLTLTLPYHPKSIRDEHGNLLKKKKKKHKRQSAEGLEHAGGLHCELRYSEAWDHGMEFQHLTDS